MTACSATARPPAPSLSVKLRPTRRRRQTRVAAAECEQQREAAHDAFAEEEATANWLGQQLRRWVEDEGGLVHPALELSLATSHGYRLLPHSCKLRCNVQGAGCTAMHVSPLCSSLHQVLPSNSPASGSSCRDICCSCRGVVAQEAISENTAARAPLIAVPERCLLTTTVAAERLSPVLAGRPRQSKQQPWWALAPQQQHQQPPPPELLLALLLAAERRRGAGSFWWPYIAALSPLPPCGWALPAQQLHAELAELGSMAAGWEPRVQAAAAAVERQAQAAAAAYGGHLGGVDAADVRWALGHVLSRCFGSGRGWGWLELARAWLYLVRGV